MDSRVVTGMERSEEEGVMVDIVDKIMAEFESDPIIHAKSLKLAVVPRGFLRCRKVMNVYGKAESAREKERALEIVHRQVGDDYEVANRIVVTGEPN